MTGFGHGEVDLDRGSLVVEVRAVNHRYCEVRASWPRALGLPPGFGEDVVKKRLGRGRAEVRGAIVGPPREPNVDDLVETLAPLVALRDRLDPEGPIPWALAPLLPTEERSPAATDEHERAALDALGLALDGVDAMRDREGRALESELQRLSREVGARALDARRAAEGRAERARARLHERVDALLGGRSASLDPARLALEIALLADKADVTEELSRFEAHLAELDVQIGADGQVGRRLDFLLQEMNREVNTLGAKSADGRLSYFVVELKSLLEKIREQAQNVL